MYLKSRAWIIIAATVQFLTGLNLVNCSIDKHVDSFPKLTSTVNPTSPDSTNNFEIYGTKSSFEISNNSNTLLNTTEQELHNVLNLLPSSIRKSARSYIASKLRRIVIIPTSQEEDNTTGSSLQFFQSLANLTVDLKTLSKSKYKPFNPHGKRMLGSNLVPIIPDGVPTPKWIPGELITSQISKREIQLINKSMFGPLRSVTMFPSVMSSILVFSKRYHPEKLAQILKYNYGVEAEPNGLIEEA